MDEIYNEVSKMINPVYIVGGSVRDELLNKEPKDYDFTTPMTPDEVEKRIKKAGRRAYLIGKRFGTIGVKIGTLTTVKNVLVEITTFRQEKYRKGSRKPDVTFVKDITADLSRRDFTINAIARRGNRYIDPFDGRKDLLINKVIKCVGKPNARFKEDPLRMLRAARFASQLNFKIDDTIKKSILQLNYKILEVSRERWVMELDKLLTTEKPSLGLCFLAQTKLLNFMIPELSLQLNYDQNSPHHKYDLWTHTLKVVDNISNDINLRWASLLHDIAKPFVRKDREDRSTYIRHDLLGKEIVIKIAKYFKWSNDRTEIVSNLVLNHLDENSPLKVADRRGK